MSTQAKAPATDTEIETVETGSGNVFADLGLPDPDERQLRVQLALRLNDLLQAEGLTQAAAAKRLGIAQPHVSELKHYKLSRFSSERLLHYITLLKEFGRPGITGQLQSASCKRGIDQFNRPSVGIGFAGDLAQNPVVAAGIGQHQRRPQFLSRQI